MNSKFTLDSELLKAADVYCRLIFTPSSVLLVSARSAVDKISTFLRSIDLEETDDKGKPKYPIQAIVGAIKNIPTLTKDLAAAEKAVNAEINEFSKIRGQKQKSMLDDGIDFFMKQ